MLGSRGRGNAIMTLVAFPSRRSKPDSAPPPGRRMRRAGALVLVVGLLSAGVLYWIETRNTVPGVEELIPGYSRAASRQMGIFYGHAGEVMWEWRRWMAQPANQALIVVAVSAVVALACFRVAWLDEERAREDASH